MTPEFTRLPVYYYRNIQTKMKNLGNNDTSRFHRGKTSSVNICYNGVLIADAWITTVPGCRPLGYFAIGVKPYSLLALDRRTNLFVAANYLDKPMQP